MLTAHAMNTDLTLARDVGANACHPKPVELAQLLEQVATLNNSEANTEGAVPA